MALTKVTMGLLSGLVDKVMDIMKDHSNINLGEAKAATGTFVDFMIPAGVKRITVMFDGVSTNGTSAIIIQIGSNSLLTSGYRGGCTNPSAFHANTSGFLVLNSIAASDVMQAIAFLERQDTSKWVCMSNAALNVRAYTQAGGATLSNVLNLLRITTVNGTDLFDAGAINVSWEF